MTTRLQHLQLREVKGVLTERERAELTDLLPPQRKQVRTPIEVRVRLLEDRVTTLETRTRTPTATREYQAEVRGDDYEKVDQFLAECTEIGNAPNAVVFCVELYGAYLAWNIAHAGLAMPRRTFITTVKDTVRGNGARYGTQRRGGQAMRGFAGMSMRTVWGDV